MEVHVRQPTLAEHAAGAELLRTSLGFAPTDAVPAWLMHATEEAGGLTLGAFASGGELLGWSYAVAARREGRDELLSCGLAVAQGHRSSGVGRALKERQRSVARERGIERIRWTADPLAAPALRLYLSQLGARLIGYRAGLYDEIRCGDGIPQDDVDIEWDLTGGGHADPGAEQLAIELPYRRSALGPDEHLAWRMVVRERLSAALEGGYVGTGVRRDADAARAWLVLGRTPA